MKLAPCCLLLLVVASQVAAEPQPVTQAPSTNSTNATTSLPEQQLGHWQTAASNTLAATTKLSFTIDVMKWHQEMNSQLVAPTSAPQNLGFAIRGAYQLSGKWQGYLQIERLPQPSAEAFQPSPHYHTGVRYTFSSGLFLEGGVLYEATAQPNTQDEQLTPRLSFGYQF